MDICAQYKAVDVFACVHVHVCVCNGFDEFQAHHLLSSGSGDTSTNKNTCVFTFQNAEMSESQFILCSSRIACIHITT